jgi:hypothetical protein
MRPMHCALEMSYWNCIKGIASQQVQDYFDPVSLGDFKQVSFERSIALKKIEFRV